MKTIHKYPIDIRAFTMLLPQGAQVLTVQTQGGAVFLWALVDPDAPKVKRLISVYGTGHDVADDAGQYVATFQVHGGALVFHVFDGGEE